MSCLTTAVLVAVLVVSAIVATADNNDWPTSAATTTTIALQRRRLVNVALVFQYVASQMVPSSSYQAYVITFASVAQAKLLYSQAFSFDDGATELGDNSTIGSVLGANVSVRFNQLRLTQNQPWSAGAFFVPSSATACAANGWRANFTVRLFWQDLGSLLAQGLGMTFAWGPLKSYVNTTIPWQPYQFGFAGAPALSFNIRTNYYAAYDYFPGFDISTTGSLNPEYHDQVLPWTSGDGQTLTAQVQVRWSPSLGASFTSTNFANNANYTNMPVPNVESDVTARTRFVFAFAACTDNYNWQEFAIDNVRIESEPEDCANALGALWPSCCDIATSAATTAGTTMSSTAKKTTTPSDTELLTTPTPVTTPTLTATSTVLLHCSTFVSCQSCVANATCFWCMETSKCVPSALDCQVLLRKCLLDDLTTATTTTVPPPTLPRVNATGADSSLPPAWIFGAAGGGFAALLLLIGAVSLGCWCNKRNSNDDAQMQSLHDAQMQSLHDAQMQSFRDADSATQPTSQYAAFSIPVQPSNEYGAAPVIAPPSNYSSPFDVAVPPTLQHYDSFVNVKQLEQMNATTTTNQYEPAPVRQ